MMDHPNIARVFDGGATNGRPYFVMELVRRAHHRLPRRPAPEHGGTASCSWKSARRFSTARSSKRSSTAISSRPNVLVTPSWMARRIPPKVIDFGIAKATEAEDVRANVLHPIQPGDRIASLHEPEQAGLGGLDVDTRSDIYSLGVLLVLTGRTPFSNEELLKAGLSGVLRLIREKEPPRPSTRLPALAREQSLAVASRRGRTGKVKPPDPGRPRLDRDEGAGKGPGPACWNRQWIRAGRPALPGPGARHGSGAAAFGLSLSQVRPTPNRFCFRYRQRVCLRHLAGDHDQHPGGSAGDPPRAGGGAVAAVARSGKFILRNTVYAADADAGGQSLERGDDETARQTLRRYFPAASQPDLRGWEWRTFWHRAKAIIPHPERSLERHNGGGLRSQAASGSSHQP